MTLPLITILPLLAAVIIGLFPSRWKPSGEAAWLVAFLGSAAVLCVVLAGLPVAAAKGASGYFMGGWNGPHGIEHKLDMLNWFVLAAVSSITLALVSYSLHMTVKEVERGRLPLFYSLFMICYAGVLGMLVSNDLFNIYVFLEIASISAYGLVMVGKGRRALYAAFNYLVTGSVAAALFLAGAGIIYAVTGTLNLTDISHTLEEGTKAEAVAVAFIITGLCIKFALFPFHSWMTMSYASAPSFVSAFFSAVAGKAAFYLMIKIAFAFPAGFAHMRDILMILSCMAMVYGSFCAIMQSDVRKVFAFSSVSSLGYMALALTVMDKSGMQAAFFAMLNHSLAAAVFFTAAGVAVQGGKAGFREFEGLGRAMPAVSSALLLAGLATIGFPFTPGFAAKIYLIKAAMQNMDAAMAVTACASVALSSVLAVAYVFKVMESVYFRPRAAGMPGKPPLRVNTSVWALAAALLVAGFYGLPVSDATTLVTEQLAGR